MANYKFEALIVTFLSLFVSKKKYYFEIYIKNS